MPPVLNGPLSGLGCSALKLLGSAPRVPRGRSRPVSASFLVSVPFAGPWDSARSGARPRARPSSTSRSKPSGRPAGRGAQPGTWPPDRGYPAEAGAGRAALAGWPLQMTASRLRCSAVSSCFSAAASSRIPRPAPGQNRASHQLGFDQVQVPAFELGGFGHGARPYQR
jgi:hypothetical protein